MLACPPHCSQAACGLTVLPGGLLLETEGVYFLATTFRYFQLRS